MNSFELGKKIDRILFDRKINKTEFSRLIGKGRTQVHNYINGTVTMSFDVLIVIADALEISLDVLCDRPQYIPQEYEIPTTNSIAAEVEEDYGNIVARVDDKIIDLTKEQIDRIRLDNIEAKLDKLLDRLD